MTIIRNTDDLLRLLEQNREFREAVRRLILTDELLELPMRFNRFEERVERFITEQEEFNREQREFNQRQLDTNDSVQSSLRQIRDSIGELRGNVARSIALDHIPEITDHAGLEYKDLLVRAQRVQLLRTVSHQAIPNDQRRSFYRADLIILGQDPQGQENWIALEASYTADERDTERALRNANILTDLTSKPAKAAIASVSNDHRIQDQIDSGEVLWYPLDPADFTPE